MGKIDTILYKIPNYKQQITNKSQIQIFNIGLVYFQIFRAKVLRRKEYKSTNCTNYHEYLLLIIGPIRVSSGYTLREMNYPSWRKSVLKIVKFLWNLFVICDSLVTVHHIIYRFYTQIYIIFDFVKYDLILKQDERNGCLRSNSYT